MEEEYRLALIAATNVDVSALPIEMKDYDPIANFKELKPTGKLPSTAYGMAGVCHGSLLYVFSGYDKEAKPLPPDLWCLDIETATWTIVESHGTPPSGRNFHSIVYYDKSLYVFGGKSHGYQNDLYQFNLTTHTWTKLSIDRKNRPSRRYGHTAVVINDNMYVLGGYDEFGEKSNEIYQYNFENDEWKRVIPTSGVVPGMLHHSTVAWQGSLYTLVSSKSTCDLYEYRISTGAWAVVTTKGRAPSPRSGHRAVVHENCMYVVGGADSAICSSDLLRFHFETSTWERQVIEGPPPRYYHILAKSNDSLIVFSGMNTHSFIFNDTFIYPLDKYREKRSDTLISDFKKMLFSGDYSDITFVFNDDTRSINAHRCVLYSRCEGFRAMLSSGMRESNSGVVKVTDTPYDVFLQLVEYIYTSHIPENISVEDVIELLKLGDQYFLEHLKSLCERFLFKYVDTSNVVTMHTLADNFNAVELKEFCFKFMLKHYETLVLKQEGEQVPEDLLASLRKYLKL